MPWAPACAERNYRRQFLFHRLPGLEPRSPACCGNQRRDSPRGFLRFNGVSLIAGQPPATPAVGVPSRRIFRCATLLVFCQRLIANFALFSTLPKQGDLVLCDNLIHASTSAGRAQVEFARHNDVDHFEQEIVNWLQHGGRGCVWIAIESLYGTEGDTAPIAQFIDLATKDLMFAESDRPQFRKILPDSGFLLP